MDNAQDKMDTDGDNISTNSTCSVHILLQTIIKHICLIKERQGNKAHQRYVFLCQRLFDISLLDDSYQNAEFDDMRDYLFKIFQVLLNEKLEDEDSEDKTSSQDSTSSSSIVPIKDSRYRSDFEQLQFLAEGYFGKVYKARHRLDGVDYAIKKILMNPSNIKQISLQLNEVKLIAPLKHPNVMNYCNSWIEPINNKQTKPRRSKSEDIYNTNLSNNYKSDLVNVNSEKSSSQSIDFKSNSSIDQIQVEPCSSSVATTSTQTTSQSESSYSPKKQRLYSLFIQMSYCKSTLRSWLDDRNNYVCVQKLGLRDFSHHDESQSNTQGVIADNYTHYNILLEMFSQLVSGVEYIHSEKIIHHDIKPDNILLDVSPEGVLIVKLADFGLACEKQLKSQKACHGSQSIGGNNNYAAPEQQNRVCHPKNDLYSLGIILMEMFQPFQTYSERAKVFQDISTSSALPTDILNKHPEIYSLIRKLTTKSLSERICLKTLKNVLDRIILQNTDSDLAKSKRQLLKFQNKYTKLSYRFEQKIKEIDQERKKFDEKYKILFTKCSMQHEVINDFINTSLQCGCGQILKLSDLFPGVEM